MMNKSIERSYINSLAPAVLTFEAEEWGRSYDPENVAQVLVELVTHQSPMVREGALLGIGHLKRRGYWSDEVASAVEKALADPVGGVRRTAEDVLV